MATRLFGRPQARGSGKGATVGRRPMPAESTPSTRGRRREPDGFADDPVRLVTCGSRHGECSLEFQAKSLAYELPLGKDDVAHWTAKLSAAFHAMARGLRPRRK